MSKKYISKKYSKILAMNGILTAFNEHSQNKNQLIIHTANGIYIGTLREKHDYDNLEFHKDDDMLTLYNKMYQTFLDKSEEAKDSSDVLEINENPLSIELENVELLTHGTNINMPFVEIFLDQIIAFSLGSISQ